MSFFFFIKIQQNTKKVDCVATQKSQVLNSHLPRWLFETISMCLSVREGPLTSLLKGIHEEWSFMCHRSLFHSIMRPNIIQGQWCLGVVVLLLLVSLLKIQTWPSGDIFNWLTVDLKLLLEIFPTAVFFYKAAVSTIFYNNVTVPVTECHRFSTLSL